jgi:xylulokinase
MKGVKLMPIMGIDMGTSGCKAVVFDENWNVVSESYREYPLAFEGDGLLEIDPGVVFCGIETVIAEANAKMKKSFGSKARVDAVAVSAIGDVIIPLGKDGRAVRNSIIDFDRRGQTELDEFLFGRPASGSGFGTENFFGITGMPPLYIGSLAKILWLKKHEPYNFEKVAYWSTFEDYIYSRLGLDSVVSYSEASRTMLFDIRKKEWDDSILSASDISKDSLPRPVPSGTVIGTISHQGNDLGFEGKVHVVSGGHDMVCAAVGAGLKDDNGGIAIDISGSIEGLVTTMREANTKDVMLKNNLPCYPGLNSYVTFSVNLTAGVVVRWLRDMLSPDIYNEYKLKKCPSDYYSAILSKIDDKEPGNIILLPHFSGSGNPYFDPDAMGAVYGFTLDTDRRDIARAVVEGLAYEVRMQLSAFENAGIGIETLRVTGGGTGTDRQIQMKANITGKNIVMTSVTESSAMGAAAYAALATGLISDTSEPYEMTKNEERFFTPNKDAAEKFSRAFDVFSEYSAVVHGFESTMRKASGGMSGG